MPHHKPGIREPHKHEGYGECWYCNEIVIDPAVYAIDDEDGVRFRVLVCRRRLCRESAKEGAFYRNDG